MLDVDTFLVWLYVVVDDFCKTSVPVERRPGPAPALSRSEVVTLALFEQWARFSGERDFYRWAQRHLRAAFPTLPARSQFNRLMRAELPALAACGQYFATQLGAATAPYEAFDSTAVPVRNVKRRGRGWLPGQATIGYSTSLGWYHGLVLGVAGTPAGIITGWVLAPANTNDHWLGESFFALRHTPDARVPGAGPPSAGPYVTDTGFEGPAWHAPWADAYGAVVVCRPQVRSKRAWSAAWRRWLAGLRQIVETVIDHLHYPLRLRHERPHALTGVLARIAAKVALHNFCGWLNRQLARPTLAVADLIAW
jgi:hypothetical protein